MAISTTSLIISAGPRAGAAVEGAAAAWPVAALDGALVAPEPNDSPQASELDQRQGGVRMGGTGGYRFICGVLGGAKEGPERVAAGEVLLGLSGAWF